MVRDLAEPLYFTYTVPSSDGTGQESWIDLPGFFAQVIPQALAPRLRFFMNSGCYGALSSDAAIHEGFKAAAGNTNDSLGPLIVDAFLGKWIEGYTLQASSDSVNSKCRHNAIWGLTLRAAQDAGGVEAPIRSLTQSEYCELARMQVSESFPGAARLTIYNR